MKKEKEYPLVTTGSGNVFADLGLPHPEVEMARVELAIAIKRLIEKRKLTQAEAAKLAGERQPNISNIVGGLLERYSCERLLRILVALGQDVTISLSDAPVGRARGVVAILPGPAPVKSFPARPVRRQKQG